MRITVFGATGRTGRHIVDQALARGYEVTAFARSPGRLGAEHKHLEIVQGDIREAEKVDRAIEGAEAVISALGPTENEPTPSSNRKTAMACVALATMRASSARLSSRSSQPANPLLATTTSQPSAGSTSTGRPTPNRPSGIAAAARATWSAKLSMPPTRYPF